MESTPGAGPDDRGRTEHDGPTDEADLPVDVGAAPESPAPAPPADDPQALRDRWLRAEAEVQNVRRRMQRELEEVRRIAEERALLEQIGTLDDLERALEAARAAGAPESWTEGVRLVAQRMSESLTRQGVSVLDPKGERFDPAFHEAMLEVPSGEVPPGHVLQVVLRGYRRHDRALRPARVVVARTPEPS